MNPEGAIIDLDGTVYRGDNLIPGAADAIAKLRNGGTKVLFVSNKPTERLNRYEEKLNEFGIECKSTDVLTSAVVTSEYLSERYPDSVSYVVGEEPLRDELRASNLAVTEDPEEATTVIASMDRQFNFTTLTDALHAIDDETHFIATNPDRTCPTSNGEIPDAAGMIGAIEGVTGQELDAIMGKPSEGILTVSMDRLGVTSSKSMIIGDRLETDIKMGNEAGMTTILVLSGVTNREEVDKSEIQPDYTIQSLGDIDEVGPVETIADKHNG